MTSETDALADHIVEANKMVSAPAEMPGERQLAKLMMAQFYAEWFAPGKFAHNRSVYWDFVNGESAWLPSARAVLDLFAPILAEKERQYELASEGRAAFAARALAAEAALAGLRQNIVDAAVQCDDARKAQARLDRLAAAIRAEGE